MSGKPTAEARKAYQLFKDGATIEAACKKAGVHISTLYRWIEKAASKKKTAKSA